jgi:5-methylthioadenosine/S-adenosylhomocysteine deaminase
MNAPLVHADLILRGRVMTFDTLGRVIGDGAIAIADGRILGVGSRAEIAARYTATRDLAPPDAIILPGFTDSHTHSTQSLVRSLVAGELPMIYRLYIPADMALTPDEAHIGAQLCAAQLALSGVTTVCDFATGTTPEHEEAIIAGVLAAGLRCVFLRGNGDQVAHHAALYSQITQRSHLRVTPGQAARDLDRTEILLKRAALDPEGFFAAGVCPSGLLGFSPDYFQAASALAERYDATLQVHAARDREEVEFSLACFGRRPIEQLYDMGVVNDRLVVVHAILAGEKEIEILGRGGAAIAHSAAECVNILNRVPSVARWQAAGITVGLGCDNAVNDMFSVLHTAWALQIGIHGLANYEPDVLTERDLLTMATMGGARLTRQQTWRGSIAPGKVADLVVLDGGAPHLFPLQDPYADLVRFAGRSNVRHVLVGGAFVVEEFRNCRVDVPALARAAAPIAAKLAAELGPRRYRSLCC